MTDTKHRRDPFGFDPTHVVYMRVEWASDREIPADWPCQIVRRAAALMKQRAEAATPGPWISLDGGDRLMRDPGLDIDLVVPEYVVDEPMSNAANAEHIAALHPLVATAVADAWEHQADDMADHLAHLHACAGEPGYVVQDEREVMHHDWTATLRAALAYLREEAPKAVGSDA